MKKFKILFLTMSFFLTFNLVANAMENKDNLFENFVEQEEFSIAKQKNTKNNTKVKKLETHLKGLINGVEIKTESLKKLFSKIQDAEIKLINLSPCKFLKKKCTTNHDEKNLKNNFKNQEKLVESIMEIIKNFDMEWKKEYGEISYFSHRYSTKIRGLLNKELEKCVISYINAEDYEKVLNTLIDILKNLNKANATLFYITQMKKSFEDELRDFLSRTDIAPKNFFSTPDGEEEKPQLYFNYSDKVKLNDVFSKYSAWCNKEDFGKYKNYLQILMEIYSCVFHHCASKFMRKEILDNMNFENIKDIKDVKNILEEEGEKSINKYHEEVKQKLNEIILKDYKNLEEKMESDGLESKDYCFVNNLKRLEQIHDFMIKINKKKEDCVSAYLQSTNIEDDVNCCKNILNLGKEIPVDIEEIIDQFKKKFPSSVLQEAILRLIHAFEKKAEFDQKDKYTQKFLIKKYATVLVQMVNLHEIICQIMGKKYFYVDSENKFSIDEVIKISNKIKENYAKILNSKSPTIAVSSHNILNLWGFFIDLSIEKHGENDEIKEIKEYVKKKNKETSITEDDYVSYYYFE